jgi:hypothetical protein
MTTLQLTRSELMCSANYINGEWRAGVAGARYQVSAPASGPCSPKWPAAMRPTPP